MALRPGFIIPNAQTYAPDFPTAQPDQGDFLILGNSQSGVVTGCAVALSGFTASLGSGPHIVVLNGNVYVISGNTDIAIQGKGLLPRWDLAVFDAGDSGFSVITGTPSDNAVYPDITENMVVFAAIYVPASGGNDPYLMDKRNFLQTTLVSGSTGKVIRTFDGVATEFELDGDGTFRWGSATVLAPISDGVLGISHELQIDTVTAADAVTVNGYDVVTSYRIGWGPLSERPDVPASGIGMVWVDTDSGDLSIYRSDGWSSGLTELPTGMIIMSVETPANMPGWLPLWGGTYSSSQVGNLWTRHPEWIASGVMTLPDWRYRWPIGTGTGGPAAGSLHGDITDQIGTIPANLTYFEFFLPPGSGNGQPFHDILQNGLPVPIHPPTVSVNFYIKI